MARGVSAGSALDERRRVRTDDHKRKKGSKIHLAVDTLGHLLALTVTAANEDDCRQIESLTQQIQQATGTTWNWRTWSELHRGKGGSGNRATWHRVGSCEAAAGEEGLRAVTTSTGVGAEF